MINEQKYKQIITKMMNLREINHLKKTDFVTMTFLMAILNDVEIKEIKQKQIADFTTLSKSDVSKSIKRLINTNILIRVDNPFEHGFLLNIK